MHLGLMCGDPSAKVITELGASRVDQLVDFYIRKRLAPDTIPLTVGHFNRCVVKSLGGKDAPNDIEHYVLPYTPKPGKKQNQQNDDDAFLKGFGYERGKKW